MPAALAAPGASNPITYIHDAAGRLEAVVDPTAASNGVARYNYDDVGNLTSITRQTAANTLIVDFSPNHGAIGDTVTIYGAGFSATPSQDVVKIAKVGGSGANGVTATVTAATVTSLTVTVPTGAITGVVYAKNTATNKTNTTTIQFSVNGSLTPTITSFSPGTAHPGDTLTINGTNFSTTLAEDVVTINETRAKVLTATSTQITATVPADTASGLVEVRTIEGSVKSTTDLVLPEWVRDTSTFSSVTRVTAGSVTHISMPAHATTALATFSATSGQWLGADLSSVSGSGWILYLIDPFSRPIPIIQGGGYFTSGKGAFDGDYAVLIVKADDASATGADLHLYVADTAVGPTVTPPATVDQNVSTPLQRTQFFFNGTANHTERLTRLIDPGSGDFKIYQPSFPDGDAVGNPMTTLYLTGSYFDVVLPETGVYSVVYEPNLTTTGEVKVSISDLGAGHPSTPTSPPPGGAVSDATAVALAPSYQGSPEAWAPNLNHLDQWTTGRPESIFESLPLPRAPSGTTALAGRVLKLNGAPLADVTLTAGQASTTTDAGGGFLLKDVPTGHQVLRSMDRARTLPRAHTATTRSESRSPGASPPR